MAKHADRKNRAAGVIIALLLASLTPLALTPAIAAPAATAITPSSGSASKSTPVEISGTDFSTDPSASGYVQDVYLDFSDGTSSYQVSMSFSVSSATTISATVSPIAAASQSATLASVVVVFASSSSSVNFTFLKPTLTSVSPSVGSASGGTPITLSGTGFYDGGLSSGVTSLKIGDEVITDFTVVSDTVITASMPVRTGTGRTVGSKNFSLVTGMAATGNVSFDFVPVRDAATDSTSRQVLGELASRSQGKSITRSSTSPYFVDGIDSLSGQPYRYRTNALFNPSNSFYSVESKEASVSGGITTATVTVENNFTAGGRTVDSVIVLEQARADCDANGSWNNASQGAYCSVFGPQFYTEAFYGEANQNISFNWYPTGGQDDYEFYAFLVSVTNSTTIPASNSQSNTVVAHAMGKRNVSSFWETSTAEIPADGLYRFRFVAGSYDGTGGLVLGSKIYVDSLFSAGLENTIDFGPIADQTGTTGTFTATAQSSSSDEVTITSATTGKCTVTTSYSSPVTTVTITKLDAGTCTLNASQGASGGYAAAETVVVSFQITAEPAPSLGAYSPASYSLTVGTAKTIAAPTNTGGTVTTWSVAPTLPAGMSINATTGVISGTPTTVQAYILYTVYAANNTGSSSAVISIEVVAAPVAETPAPTTKPPTPLVPEITQVNPNRVTVDGGETIVVTGRGFGTAGQELFIGGVKVTIISSTANEMRFIMPAMAIGVYDLRYVYSGGSNLTYLNAITVVAKPVTVPVNPGTGTPATQSPVADPSKNPWRVKVTVNPFAPGRSELTPALRSMIRQHVRTYAKFATQVECVGFTMGPTVLRVDAALSLARAKAICDYIKVLRPRLEVNTIAGRQDRVVADRVRRVEVDFIRPDTRTTN